jgi:alkylation response protein AidB-like acyl-CoA dehydrogenase
MADDWIERVDRVAAAVAAEAEAHDDDDSFVAEGYRRLKAEGLFKALVPAELGGGGAGFGEIARCIRRIGGSCGSTALAFAMHSHLVAVAAWRWRHQNAPTDGLLKRVAGEDLVLVSSGGSDWLPSGGTAMKVEGGFRVNARKPFSSGCPAGDLLVTSAVHHFAVPLGAQGVRRVETWRAMGMRGTGSHDLLLEDVFVPDAAISGRRPQGKWHPLFHAISMIAFPLIYAAYVGVADGARARAIAAARGRTGDPHLPYLVGEMENEFALAEMALERMIAQATGVAMTCRALAQKGAIGTVEKAMEVAGGAAFYRALGLERAYRDVQGARYHPLQAKPQLLYSGRLALGWNIDGPGA